LAFGVKAIETRQLLFAGSSIPVQPSLDIAKSPALVPEILANILVKDAFPLFVRVTTPTALPGITWFPKLSGVGDSAAFGVAPFPVKDIGWIVAGLP
jgi:hypothetical protein